MATGEVVRFAEVGARLARVRGSRTQSEMAGLWGMSVKTYGFYERGVRLPSPKLLEKLHTGLFVDLNWLFTGQAGKAERVAVLDSAALADSIETALLSAEAVKERGKTHTLQQIAAHAGALYEIAIRESVDRIVSPVENELTKQAEALLDEPGNENGDHALRRVGRAGER